MKLLGLTGGMGMGKSTAAGLLRQRGVAVVDTDELARQVVEPGQPALKEIAQQLGPKFLDASGCLKRQILADHVFGNPAALKTLEGILHPRIRALWQAQALAWRAEGCPITVVVIPLLFETEAEKDMDGVICAACTAASQQKRLIERGWSQDHIKKRLASQWPTEQKIARSNFLLWTEGGLEVHAAQIDRILARVAKK